MNTNSEVPAPTQLSGSEPLCDGARSLGVTVLDFWRWYCSDMLSNATRGVLAEFIVARALGVEGGCRVEWDSCDIVLPSGKRIEVKTSAYVQSWSQRKPSRISYSIAARRGWDASTNTSAADPCRSADVYVFCLHAHLDKATANPLDVSQWRFHVLARAELDRLAAGQKTIGLSSLLAIGAVTTSYSGLRQAVMDALA